MKKKLIRTGWYSWPFLFIALHVSSCKKDGDPNNDVNENYAVAIKFNEFEQAISPMVNAARKPAGLSKLNATTRPATATEEGSLYYWSFNQQTLTPDVAVGSGATLILNEGSTAGEYGAGWVYDAFVAGQAVSVSNLAELVIKMPLGGVSRVSAIAFDIGSSGTGPKSVAISYSQDGSNYTLLSENNQFSNTNASQAKNSFSFQMTALSLDYTKELYIKLIPLAGERGTASAYRAATGVTKLDNIRLMGVTGEASVTAIKTLQYHVFDEVSQELVSTGLYDYGTASLANFSISLPAGNYIASFVSNESPVALPIPGDVRASSYFVSNLFTNYQAKIYGVLHTFEVAEDMELELTLNRYYSEGKVEFTDEADLSMVVKMVITRRHKPMFYAPFNSSLANPLEGESSVTINPIFTEDNKSIVFNQFIGNVSASVPVAYRIDAYNASNAIIKSFDVEASIVNNVQLLFRGALLKAGETGPNFTIMFDEKWGGNQVVDF